MTRLMALTLVLIFCAVGLADAQVVLSQYRGFKRIENPGPKMSEGNSKYDTSAANGAILFTAGRNVYNENDYVVESVDLILRYQNADYQIPFARLCAPVLESFRIFYPATTANLWIIEIATTSGGGKGPQYDQHVWFYLQAINGNLLLLPTYLEMSDMGGIPELKIETARDQKRIYVKLTAKNEMEYSYTLLTALSGIFSVENLMVSRFTPSPKWANAVDTLNVRARPDLNANIIGRIEPGEQVILTDVSGFYVSVDGNDAPWYKVLVGAPDNPKVAGWVYGAYLK